MRRLLHVTEYIALQGEKQGTNHAAFVSAILRRLIGKIYDFWKIFIYNAAALRMGRGGGLCAYTSMMTGRIMGVRWVFLYR